MPTPDRPIFALAPTRQQALTRKEEGTLSDQQKKQLSSITLGYLREHSILDSYTNIQRAIPVVRGCIQEGLFQAANRRRIDPSDNLTRAYRAGKEGRDDLLERIREVDTITGEGDYLGPLALPKVDVDATLPERRSKVFEPNFTRSRALLAEIGKRRPIFGQLLELARTEVERAIPSARAVELTPEQEAGLVRNFVFAQIGMDRSFPIVEVEDFVANRDVYLGNVNLGVDKLLGILTQGVALDDPQATKRFLGDLTKQVAERLQAIQGGQLRSFVDVTETYRRLNAYFVVENPFQRLPEFSENPEDRGKSLWDPVRTEVVSVEGKTYQVPHPEVLQFSALRAKAANNMQRAAEFERASVAVSHFLNEATSSEYPDAIAAAERKLAVLRMELDQFDTQVSEGSFPREALMTGEQIHEYAQKQRETMEDERAFIPFAKAQIDSRKERAIALLGKYADGRKAEAEDAGVLEDLHFAPREILARVRYFYRDRLTRRVVGFEKLYTEVGVDLSSIGITANLQPFFKYGMDTSAIDILRMRSTHWRDAFLGTSRLFREGNSPLAWLSIVQFEKDRIDTALYAKAYKYTSRYMINATEEEWAETAQDLAQNKAEEYLGGKDSPLRKRYERLKKWQDALVNGEVPPVSEIPASLVNAFISDRERDLNSALGHWDPEMRLSQALTFRLERIGMPAPEVKKYPGEKPTNREMAQRRLRRLLATPHGPTQIIIGSLAKMVPSDDMLVTGRSLEETVHRYKPVYLQFNYGPEEVKEQQRAQVREYREQYRQWLANLGYTWEDEVFNWIAPMSTHYDLSSASDLIGTMYGVEGEINKWFDHQEEKLERQTKEGAPILAAAPSTLITQKNFELSNVVKNLTNLRAQAHHQIESRVRQLTALGAIRDITTPTSSSTSVDKQ